MKLVIVTAVEEFQNEIIKLFKKTNIKNFSKLDIEGYKKGNSVSELSNWFASDKYGNESILFFSFTEAENIDALFELIKEFNISIETNNPIRAIIVPIEKFI